MFGTPINILRPSQANQPLGFLRPDENGVVPASVSVRRGTSTELDAIVLRNGELAIELDDAGGYVAQRIGDGVTAGGYRTNVKPLVVSIIDENNADLYIKMVDGGIIHALTPGFLRANASYRCSFRGELHNNSDVNPWKIGFLGIDENGNTPFSNGFFYPGPDVTVSNDLAVIDAIVSAWEQEGSTGNSIFKVVTTTGQPNPNQFPARAALQIGTPASNHTTYSVHATVNFTTGYNGHLLRAGFQFTRDNEVGELFELKGTLTLETLS